VSEGQCRTCSLAPVCLPEEERFVHMGKTKPQRLFPPEDDRRVIHVVEQGCSIRKNGDQLIVYFPDGNKKPLPGMAIASLVLHGNIQISTQSIHFCAANDIGVHWLSFGGHYVGALSPGSGGVQRRNRQYQAFQNSLFRAQLALRLAKAKVENQLKYILRSVRSRKEINDAQEVEKKILVMRIEIKGLGQMHDKLPSLCEDNNNAQTTKDDQETSSSAMDSIRGHEGMAGRLYFSLFPAILNLRNGDGITSPSRRIDLGQILRFSDSSIKE
jgi:CRISPR-associated protein Cas1